MQLCLNFLSKPVTVIGSIVSIHVWVYIFISFVPPYLSRVWYMRGFKQPHPHPPKGALFMIWFNLQGHALRAFPSHMVEHVPTNVTLVSWLLGPSCQASEKLCDWWGFGGLGCCWPQDWKSWVFPFDWFDHNFTRPRCTKSLDFSMRWFDNVLNQCSLDIYHRCWFQLVNWANGVFPWDTSRWSSR